MTTPTATKPPAPDPELLRLAAEERTAWHAWLDAKERLRAAHERVCRSLVYGGP